MYRDEAKVSVFDSGFLLGDGIWEGLRLHKNRWTFFEDHMERFFEALKLVEINFNFSVNQIYEQLEKTRLSNNMNTDVYADLWLLGGKKSNHFSTLNFLFMDLRML